MASAALLPLLATLVLLLTPSVSGQGSVTITINDFHGRALPGAEVKLTNTTVSATKVTDSSGQVTFSSSDGIEDDRNYTLSVKYLGVTVYSRGNWNYSDPGSPKTINVEVFDLKIKVYSHEKKDVVPSARVKVASSATSPITDEEKATGSDGVVTFGRLPGSGTTYSILINYTVYGVSVTSNPTVALSLDSYSSIYEYEIALYRLKIIAKDRGSAVVPDVGLRVWRTSKSGPLIMTGSTGADGSLSLSLLPGGTYVAEATYRGDVVESSVEIPVSGNVERTIELPLTRMVVKVNDLSGDPVSGYSLLGRLLTDGSVYAEVRGSTGELDFGRVYDERGYTLSILFEGQEVYSEEIPQGGIGNKSVIARFGDFSVALSDTELFGELSSLLPRAEVRLRVGSFEETKPLTEGFALFRKHPLVEYSYEVLLDSDIIGSGTLPLPSHQSVVRASLITKTLGVRAYSLQEEPIDGILELSVGAQPIGSTRLWMNGTIISGLLPIDYSYRLVYKGVAVAEGGVAKSILGGALNISARVSDIYVTVLDFLGVDPLPGAFVTLSTGEYNSQQRADLNGTAVFDRVPISAVQVKVVYRGVKVYDSPASLSTGQLSLTISGTGVYTVVLRVVDGEKKLLEGGRIEISVGDLTLEEELGKEVLLLRGIPNGSLTYSVEYLDVEVAEGIREVTRNGVEIEIEARVYPLRATVMMHTNAGPQPLSNAEVVFKIEGKTRFEGVTKDGVVSGKLPAADYDVLVTYQGETVGLSRVTHKGFTDLRLDVKVYQATLRLLGIDERPLPNTTLTIKRGGKNIALVMTDEGGVGVAYLAEGEYTVEFVRDGKSYSIPIKVKGLLERSILHSPEPASSLTASLAVAAGLLSISIYGLIRPIKPSIERREKREEDRGRGERWSRGARRNV